MQNNMNEGWICPKCGTVNAPWKATCDCNDYTYIPNLTPLPYNPLIYPTYPWTYPTYPWVQYVTTDCDIVEIVDSEQVVNI